MRLILPDYGTNTREALMTAAATLAFDVAEGEFETVLRRPALTRCRRETGDVEREWNDSRGWIVQALLRGLADPHKPSSRQPRTSHRFICHN